MTRNLTAAGRRRLAVGASVLGGLAVADPLVWLLTGGGFFWPMVSWPVYAALFGLHVTLERRENHFTERIARLTRTRRAALDAQTRELRRIERDLHDGTQARLVSVAMTIGLAESVLRADPEAAAGLLAEARASTRTALEELRTVMRSVHPSVLADRGLAGAVEALALDLAVPVTVDADLPGAAEPAVESAVYFAVAECLANVVKHSGATRASVRLTHRGRSLTAVVHDDGHGGARPGAGSGLRGVTDRLAGFDGMMSVQSPPGGPTTITLEVPCASSSPRTTRSSATA